MPHSLEYLDKPITFVQCSRDDVLGDRWARRVGDLYKAALEREGIDEIGDGMGAVWNTFQWMYCQLAEMPSRVISSPEAMVMAGWPLEDKHINMAQRLIRVQSDILEEQA